MKKIRSFEEIESQKNPEDLITEYQKKIGKRIRTMPNEITNDRTKLEGDASYTREYLRETADKALQWTPLPHESIYSNPLVTAIPDGNVRIWVIRILEQRRKLTSS